MPTIKFAAAVAAILVFATSSVAADPAGDAWNSASSAQKQKFVTENIECSVFDELSLDSLAHGEGKADDQRTVQEFTNLVKLERNLIPALVPQAGLSADQTNAIYNVATRHISNDWKSDKQSVIDKYNTHCLNIIIHPAERLNEIIDGRN